MDAKKERAEHEKKKRGFKAIMPKLFAMTGFSVSQEQIKTWILESETFPHLLRIIADRQCGDAEDVDNQYLLALCQIVTDLADKEKSLSLPLKLRVSF